MLLSIAYHWTKIEKKTIPCGLYWETVSKIRVSFTRGKHFHLQKYISET